MKETTTDKSVLRELLTKYTFAQFKTELDMWLVSGRIIVGVFGNLDKDQAFKIAENARSTFDLKTVARSELP